MQIDGVQPMCTIDDALDAEAIVHADPLVAKIVKERYGVTDVKTQLVADPWYYGARQGPSQESSLQSSLPSDATSFPELWWISRFRNFDHPS